MRTFNLDDYSRFVLRLLGTGVLALGTAGTAYAATDVSIDADFVSTDPQCSAPVFDFPVSGTNTVDDDGFGNDFVSVIIYDAGFQVLDVDNVSLPVGGVATISYTLSSRLTARPIRVRVHDTTGPVPDSDAGVTAAIATPLLAELEVDPGTASPPCAAVTMGPEIRIESAANVGNFGTNGLTQTLLDSLTLVVPDEAQLVVKYTAECGVDGPASSYLGIRIAIDGVTVAPTGAIHALCAGNGTGTPFPWFSGRILGVAEVPAGGHTVEVFGDASTGVAAWWVGNRSLSVTVPEPGLAGTLAAGAFALAGMRRRRRRGVRALVRLAFVAGFALAVFGSPGTGLAQTRIDARANPNPQTLLDATPTILELDTPGSVRIGLLPTRTERVEITVTAECQVLSASDANTYVAIEVLVDGDVVAPTNTGHAFCTSENSGGGRWSSASLTVVTDLGPTGIVQNVQLRARIQGFAAGESARIDDLSVVVVRTVNPVPLL